MSVVGAIKKIIPVPVKTGLRNLLGQYRLQKVKTAIEKAPDNPNWLSLEQLEALSNKYHFDANYKYDEESLLQRSHEAVEELKQTLPNFNEAKDFLDLGCGDGMVCYALQQDSGKKAIGIDYNSRIFAPRAAKAGVQLLEKDAEKTGFADNSFDVIFSYNSFEHFSHPDKIVDEAFRLLRTGGCLYFAFGPLYDSPWGLHGYHSVPVPYAQFLFHKDTIAAYTTKTGKFPVDYNSVNQWSVNRFDKLWKQYDGRLQTADYQKIKIYEGLELMTEYPSCFKSKTDSFESYFTGAIKILLKKIA